MTSKRLFNRPRLALWQFAFIVLGTTWLFAPVANSQLSARTTLISQYESSISHYGGFFRLGDVLAAILLISLAWLLIKRSVAKIEASLLLIIGFGMLIDPIVTVHCAVTNNVCRETFSLSFVLHAIETAITSAAVLALTVYDSVQRHRITSIVFAIFQILYGLLFFSQYSDNQHFNTLTQYIYQIAVILWLAWLARDLFENSNQQAIVDSRPRLIRLTTAVWAFLNGITAIVISLRHIHLLGRLSGLYFPSHSAWLAQHGVIVGVIMIYLSRHLWRGEQRARQIFLVILGIEVLKYAIVTPDIDLLFLYSLSFALLFAAKDYFNRGVVAMTWQIRLRDLAYMIGSLMFTAVIVLNILDRDSQTSKIASRAFSHLPYYALHADLAHRTHLESALLSTTVTTFAAISLITIFWILFKPYRLPATSADRLNIQRLLGKYSGSSEDYFKYWPADKQYFWDDSQTGFIAYKLAGPIAFALADPITSHDRQIALIGQFVDWARSHRLRVCFLMIQEASLANYMALKTLQIGSSALINSETFLNQTRHDKWWRWKLNRAAKAGYQYAQSKPSHSPELMSQLTVISEQWLSSGGHQERGFALGYFDIGYLQNCNIHYLLNGASEVVAFANELPTYSDSTATIDLLRFRPEAGDAMPYLISKIIENTNQRGYKMFDLGFVPFAKTNKTIIKVVRMLSSGSFSAKGLQQFKNKFDPDWQPNYMAYDGDLADLALIAINLEKAMLP